MELRDQVWHKFYEKKLKKCGQKVRFRYPLVIETPGKVEIGNNVSFASYVHVWGGGGVRIGENTMIASHVAISSYSHDHCKKDMHKTVEGGFIDIGKNVWIGSHSIIFPGVKIGNGAVIGANTLVNKDVPGKTIFCGTPGKVIKDRKVN
ncbi:acyltransferase [bacterium]|nr:acyltransferase [bacterium]